MATPKFTQKNPCKCGAYGGPESHAKFCEYSKAVEKQSTGIKGGKRPGAGRKPGVPNKRTAETQRKVEESGVTPLEFMLKIMRTEPDSKIEDPRVLTDILQMRFEAAKAAAPYVHAKLAAVELSGNVGLSMAEIDDAELAAIASGRSR